MTYRELKKELEKLTEEQLDRLVVTLTRDLDEHSYVSSDQIRFWEPEDGDLFEEGYPYLTVY